MNNFAANTAYIGHPDYQEASRQKNSQIQQSAKSPERKPAVAFQCERLERLIESQQKTIAVLIPRLYDVLRPSDTPINTQSGEIGLISLKEGTCCPMSVLLSRLADAISENCACLEDLAARLEV
jgi:hypothetical protein